MSTPPADPRLNTQREDQARAEVGHTDITRGLAWVMVVLLLVTLGSVPLVQHLYEVAQYRDGKREHWRPQAYDVLNTTPAWPAEANRTALGNLLTWGRLFLRNIEAYEDRLEDLSLTRQYLLPPAQLAMTATFGIGNEQAYVGRQGWLFFRADVDHVTGPPFMDPTVQRRRYIGEGVQPDPVAAILQFRDQLAARGITLIVMPVPVKPQVMPDMLSSRYASRNHAVANPSFDPLIERLHGAGVEVFDVLPLMAEKRSRTDRPTYLKTDTHWTPASMRHAAEQLASRIEQMGVPAGDTAYRIEPAEVMNPGDIAVMLKLPPGQQLIPPEVAVIEQVWTADGQAWSADEASPVLLLGDSFTNIYQQQALGWGTSAGLAAHLSAGLRQPVDVVAVNAGGAHSTRTQLFRDMRQGRDRLAGKRVVIWQFATRELSQGDWRLLAMPEVVTRQPPDPAAADAEVAVRGRIAAISRPPRPGTVAYRDCLIVLHLTEVEPAGAAGPEGDLLVYLWGMRDNIWTSAADWPVGRMIDLRLVPWDRVQEQYGAFQVRELDDDELLLRDDLPLKWADIEKVK